MKKKLKARLLLQQRWDQDHKWDCLTNEEVCRRLNQWVLSPTVPEEPLPKACKRYQEDLIYHLRNAVKDPKVRPNVRVVFASKVHPGMVFSFMDRDRAVVEMKITSDKEGAVKPGYIKFNDGTVRYWHNRQPKFYQVHIVTTKPTPRRPPDLVLKPEKWPKKPKVKKEKPKIPYVKKSERTDPMTGLITGMGEIRRAAWREMGISVREPSKKKPRYDPTIAPEKCKKKQLRRLEPKVEEEG